MCRPCQPVSLSPHTSKWALGFSLHVVFIPHDITFHVITTLTTDHTGYILSIFLLFLMNIFHAPGHDIHYDQGGDVRGLSGGGGGGEGTDR